MSSSQECRNLALNLNADPNNRHSKTLWTLLLARWSELAPEEMMAFLDSENKAGHPTKMEELAWEAWGISSPEEASLNLRSINSNQQRALIKGITQIDPSLALSVARTSPNTPALLYTILLESPEVSIDTYHELLRTASYGHHAFSFPAKHITKIAKEDPQAALEFAQQEGRADYSLISEIALENPDAVKQFLAEQPTSRTNSLAKVELAKRTAFQNPAQSLEFARALKPGPTKDVSLIAIASVIGGEDPLKGLALIEEANWTDATNLYQIDEGSTVSVLSTFNDGNIDTKEVAARLLSSLAVADSGQAEHYLNTVVPANLRRKIRERLIKN